MLMHKNNKTVLVLQSVFMLSGIAAIIYQVAWQRMLFNYFGSNSEATTTIVAVFMLGIGLGALVGEYIATCIHNARIGVFCFAMVELLIGGYGALSPVLLESASHFFISVPQGLTLIIAVGALLLVPTFAMGATLPILIRVCSLNGEELRKNVSGLYVTNSIGAAIGAILCILVLFRYLGLTYTLYVASAINFCVVIIVMALGQRHQSAQVAAEKESSSTNEWGWQTAGIFSFLMGFVSLGAEMIGMRLYSFVNQGRAGSFGTALAIFLFGLAMGSAMQGRQKKQKNDPVAGAVTSIAWFAVVCLLGAGCISWVAGYSGDATLTSVGILTVLFSLGYFGARTLPVAVTFLRTDDAPRVGRVYSLNILGCVSGTIGIGFYATDLLHTHQILQLISVLSLLCLLLLLLTARSARQYWMQVRLPGILVLAGLLGAPLLYAAWLPRLQHLVPIDAERAGKEFVFEGRSGIAILSCPEVKWSCTVWGGGAYDGKLNTDPFVDTNGIFRPIVGLATHTKPERVLVIGLSAGAWTKVILADKRVKQVDAIEISTMYRDMIAFNPVTQGILKDPRFHLYIDDGRRWLKNNNTQPYDLIVMNTTFHYREGISSLLSMEFFQLATSRLREGGSLLLNATGSKDVWATALWACKKSWLIGNNVLCTSDPHYQFSPESVAENLIFNTIFADKSQSTLYSWSRKNFPKELSLEIVKPGQVVTDNNMRTEYGLAD